MNPARQRLRHALRAAWACLFLALPALPALAAIETTLSDGSVRFAIGDNPVNFVRPTYTVFAWVRPAQVHSSAAGILQLPGAFSLELGPGNTVSARLLRTLPAASQVVTSALPLEPGRWSLVAVTYRAADGHIALYARGENTALVSAAVTSAAFTGMPPGPATGGLAIGALPGGLPAMVGVYGPIVVRNHWIDAPDFAAVWDSRRFWAAYDTDTIGAGGHMTGPVGCNWMVNHAMTTLPADGFTGAPTFERAAVVGQPVGISNFHVFYSYGPMPGPLNMVRPVAVAYGFKYRSHRDPGLDGFFLPDLPGTGLSGDVVSATAVKTRQLVTGPHSLLRVMTSGNSRAIGGTDGSVFAPSNYAHGFIELNRAKVAGVLFRPAMLSSGGGTWFGFDMQLGLPSQSPAGTIEQLAISTAPEGDFSRFWTGSGAGGRAAGDGLFIRPLGHYGLRCRAEPGTLMTATSPLTVRAHVLRFPGASTLLWRADRGVSQGAAGTQGPEQTLPLDSTVWTRELGAGDAAGPGTVTLAGDHTGSVVVGHACFVSGGAGAGSISVVRTVTVDGGTTTITLTHPFHESPSAGSLLRFGPWAFESVTHEWPALSPQDPQTFRGLRLEAGGDGAGLVVFAFSAWRPDAPGFAFGTSGWGGHGYAAQMNEAFPGVVAGWAAQSEADVWIQACAQQDNPPSVMSLFLAEVRAGRPQAEMVWAGEMQHALAFPAQGPDAWDQYILDEAAAHGVVGLTPVEDPGLGDYMDQLASGMRMDGAHLSQRGNLTLARVWTEQLRRAAVDPCLRADMDFDGALSLADFGAFQTRFALGDRLADLDGDGALTLADFGAFQTAYALGC